MLDNQALKGRKGKFLPLFLSQDPPTALWGVSENARQKALYAGRMGQPLSGRIAHV